MTNNTERSGIIQPLLKYRFRILFSPYTMYQEQSILMQNIVSCKMNMVEKTLKIKIRQPVTCGVYSMVNYIVKTKNLMICVQSMLGGNDPTSTIEFNGCECVDHFYELDYAKSDIAEHELEFKYQLIREYDGDIVLEDEAEIAI